MAKLTMIRAKKLKMAEMASMKIALGCRTLMPEPVAVKMIRHTVPMIPSVSMKKIPVTLPGTFLLTISHLFDKISNESIRVPTRPHITFWVAYG